MYAWYQTKDTVVIVIYKKDPSDRITVTDILSGLEVSFNNQITHIKIDHKYSYYKQVEYSNKLEVFLTKDQKTKWLSLEDKTPQFERAPEIPTEDTNTQTYSNDPVMNMFMKIYNESNEEVKREMNKSFVQSKGTTLRTVSPDTINQIREKNNQNKEQNK
ncbi:suppressor of G2 allele of SKP1 [Nematocida sp. AWRm80]|nr:suppressor of G2 allele of SKP1 [Nematocida sp. AWRm80]